MKFKLSYSFLNLTESFSYLGTLIKTNIIVNNKFNNKRGIHYESNSNEGKFKG